MKSLLMGILFLSLCCPALAETRYVTDVLFVPMRSGAGNQFRIIHSAIKTGTKMTVLDLPADSEWAHVRTPSGLEGWIPTQYLIESPTARMQLNDAQHQMNVAKARADELAEQLKSLRGDHKTLSEQSQAAAQSRDQLAEELRNLKTLSADAVNLSQRYKELLAQYDLIQTDYDTVRAENDRLRGEQTVNQWLFGAGLVVLGMFLMLVLPALKSKKRNTEWRD